MGKPEDNDDKIIKTKCSGYSFSTYLSKHYVDFDTLVD